MLSDIFLSPTPALDILNELLGQNDQEAEEAEMVWDNREREELTLGS